MKPPPTEEEMKGAVERLEPCPWCEQTDYLLCSEAATVESYARQQILARIVCTNPVHNGVIDGPAVTTAQPYVEPLKPCAEAIKSWNTRASTTPTRSQNAIGAAELAVGQFVYRRIEKLMDAKADMPGGRELDFLADLVGNVEEYGAQGDEDGEPWSERHWNQTRSQGEGEALEKAGYTGKADITQALMGPHEWGYRDPVEGGFIADNAPFVAAEFIAHLRAVQPAEGGDGLLEALRELNAALDAYWNTAPKNRPTSGAIKRIEAAQQASARAIAKASRPSEEG